MTPLIRRFRDKDGVVTTYLPNGELCSLVGIGSSTLACWTTQGLVRYTSRLNGSRNYAIVDAARLKLMTAEEASALGVYKTPANRLAAQALWYRQTQDDTIKRADYTGEVWDDYDLTFLIEEVEEGRPIEIIAKALGRTYAATSDRITHLRLTGDLPAIEHDEEWLARTRLLLTAEEAATL